MKHDGPEISTCDLKPAIFANAIASIIDSAVKRRCDAPLMEYTTRTKTIRLQSTIAWNAQMLRVEKTRLHRAHREFRIKDFDNSS